MQKASVLNLVSSTDNQPSMRLGRRRLAAIIGLAAIYFCAGKLGLSLAYIQPSVTACWPPSGIALAALLLWGNRLWPGVFLGAFLVNLTTPGSLATTLAIAGGNTLEALLGAWAIHRFANGARVFEQARNVFKFVLLGPVLSTAVSATFGVTSLTLGGFAQWNHYPAVWLTWWLGDAVGELVVAPLLVIWLTRPYPEWKLNRAVEVVGLLLTLVSITSLMFLLSTPIGSEYMIILPLLWAAFRFGQHGVVTSAFIIAGIALSGTLQGVGPFSHADPNDSLLHLQAFMGTVAIAALVLAAVTSEAIRAEQRLQVQEAVSRILAESFDLREAAYKIIQVLCSRAGWDLGAVWQVDRTGNEIACVELWQKPSIAAARFEAVTRELRFAPGTGLPGRVWRSGKPAWTTDMNSDDNFPRAAVAGEAGIHSAFGFPIKLGEITLGAIECFSREIREPDGNFLQMVGDIGGQLGQFVERKRSEDLRLESEKRLRAVVETAVDGILTIDEHGIINTVNPAAERIFGYHSAEMIGANVRMLMPERSRTGEREIIGGRREMQGQRKDGTLFPIELTMSEMRLGNQPIFTGTVRDITGRKQADELLRQAKDQLTKANEELETRVQERTADLEKANTALLRTFEERKRLEEKLRHAQKMESVGTLAGGIAHDFNNILNIIRGYATLIGQQPLAGWQLKESLNVIDHEIERGASVVRQLLTVARQTDTHLVPTDVNEVVSTLTELIKTFPKTIAVSLELEPQLPQVLADSAQFSRALLNLCVNARDAMPEGGQLTIKTTIADASEAADRRVDSGVAVCVAISDTGAGMSEDVRQRIFEPFFTTKGIGEGTGLGLAIVYGIVKEHNGFIDVQSVAGQGTTFKLYLPILESEKISAIAVSPQPQNRGQERPQRGGTVLVVEDEVSLVRLLTTLLPQAGYQVLTAMDGEQAIELYHRHKAEIDIVLLDLGLPKITGLDVIPRLKEGNPNVSIVVATGYLEPRMKDELMRAGVKDCINKPYVVKDVIERLGSVIETSRSIAASVA
jgi:PAS domain S-box-containing protein